MKNKNNYNILQNSSNLALKGSKNGSIKPEYIRTPLEDVERHYLQDTDTLIGLLDGTIPDTDHESTYSDRQYVGPTDEAIYLDKSARNIAFLVANLWDDMSDGSKRPKANFLNIDKEDYLEYMGFSQNGQNIQDIDPSEVSIDKIDPKFLHEMVTRIRCLFLKKFDFDNLDESNLDEAWAMKTHFDGKNIAIIDEVKSSGNTLGIALQLLKRSFPETKFNGYYWSTPPLVRWSIIDPVNGKSEISQFAVSRVPVWYDSSTSFGRGIDDRDPSWSERSNNKAQKIGKFVLSTPYKERDSPKPRKSQEPLTKQVRDDINTLCERYQQKQINNFAPSGLREKKEFEAKIESYYQTTFKDWLINRR